MTTLEVLARLTAHWPQLGGDDAQAEIRMEDWVRVVERNSPGVRRAACEALVQGWKSDWPPKIADWQEASRQVAARAELEQPALGAPREPLAPKDRVFALIEQARRTVDASRYR